MDAHHKGKYLNSKVIFEYMTKPCIFCGEECIFDEGDEGCVGVIIGNQVICTGCLSELKEALGINELEEELENISE